MTPETPGTGDVPESPEASDSPSEGEQPDSTQRSSWPWKKVAVAVGGAAVTVVGTVVATLAATHKTAVTENAAAYANGISDALKAVRDGFDPFDV